MLVSAPALAAEDKNEADEVIKCEHNSLKLATNIEGVCPVEGMRIMRCEDCEKIFYVSTSGVHMHEPAAPVEENRVEATCLADGSYDEVVRCADCKMILSSTSKTIHALGHSWDEGTVTTPATCTENGVKTFTCVRGCRKTEAIAAAGHTEVTDAGRAATCTEDGLTDGKHCTTCGTVTKVQETIPAHGHTEGEPVRENVVEATCESDGSYDSVVYCTECGAELRRETIVEAAHGHLWDEGTVTREPTTESEGERTYHCTHEGCTATKTETIPALVPDNGNNANGGINNGNNANGDAENGEKPDNSGNGSGGTENAGEPDNSSAKKTPQINTVSVPKTGDEDHGALWIALVMVSGCTMAAALRKKRCGC